MKQLLCTLTLLAFAALPLRTATNLLRVYYIGNSVTNTVRYGEVAKLAATRSVKLEWGRTMIPGTPLEWIFTHPNDGFRQEPYGTWTNALSHFAWDAVSLQPFDRHLHGKDKDGIHLNEAGSYLVGCTYFATLLKQSPVGLPTAPYGPIDPALAETIQKAVWDSANDWSAHNLSAQTTLQPRWAVYGDGKIIGGVEP